MQSELVEDIQLELKLLRKLLAQSEAVREAVAEGAAAETEKLAAASLLQSFYNGVERIFDLLAERLDASRPTGEGRHEPLLDQMTEPTADRPAILSEELRAGLKQYLEFRNSYRYSHYFRLNWPLTAELVKQCGATFERLEAELDHFVREHGKMRLLGRPEPEGLPPYWFAPPTEGVPARWRALGGPCLLACLVGIVLGVGLAAAFRYGRSRVQTQDVPPAQIRKLTALLAAELEPWQAEPHVRHAIGVLGFFDRGDWQFTFTGDKWDYTGDVTGTCPSLEGSATLSFHEGALARIDIRTSWDQYVFTLAGGRVARAGHFRLPSGAPRSLIEFDAASNLVCLSEWLEQAGSATRHDRFFRDGKVLVEVVRHADGTVEKLVLRAGDKAAVFYPMPGGRLTRDPNAPADLRDLPPRAESQPAGT